MHTRHALVTRLAVLLCTGARGAWAQPDPATAARNVALNADRARLVAGLGPEATDLTQRSPVRSPRPQITALATQTDKTAKAQIGVILRGNPVSVQLLAGASTPLDEDADQTERVSVADLTDLRGIGHAELSARFTFWRRPQITSLREAARICEDALAIVERELAPGDPVVASRVKALRDIRACDPNVALFDMPVVRARVAPLLDAAAATYASGNPVVLSIEAKGGRKTFGYVDATSPALASAARTVTPWQTRAALGYFAPRVAFVSAYFGRQRTVDEQAKVQLCRPLTAAPGVTTCGDARVGAPTVSDRNVVGGEIRRPLGSRLAVAIEVSRDLDERVTAWQVPFYFLANDSGALTGGVSIGGASGQRSVQFQVFVGAFAAPLLR